jgi:hypothetical protein
VFRPSKPEKNESINKFNLQLILLSAGWMIFFSLLPYALAYRASFYGGLLKGARYFAIPSYSIAILFIVALSLWKSQVLKWVISGLAALVMVWGLIEFRGISDYIKSQEPLPLVSKYLTLIEAVPAVRPETTFLFVDNKLGSDPWDSCTVVIQMLYSTRDVFCIYLSSTEEGLRAVKDGNQLTSPEGGTIRNENYIIVGESEDGTKYIIPEITPQSNLLIDWLQPDPIRTDYRRIIDPSNDVPSGMVLKLIEREKILSAELEP